MTGMDAAPPSLDEMLAGIAAGRAADPLAPVTVICPSHLSALQLRRRLAELTPFAAVRFETLPRLAELIGAGRLAAAGPRPMARPIGDHLAERVAAQALPPLDPIRDLPGFARALRRLFARLRRGGLRGGEPLPASVDDAHLAEVVRLYGLWREGIAAFYDEDDLLDAAADAIEEDPARAAELGALHLVPPGPRSHAGDRLLAALAAARGGIGAVADPAPSDRGEPGARPRPRIRGAGGGARGARGARPTASRSTRSRCCTAPTAPTPSRCARRSARPRCRWPPCPARRSCRRPPAAACWRCSTWRTPTSRARR